MDANVSLNSVSVTIWPLPRAENKFALLASLNVPEIEREILLFIEWFPRSHPIRPTLLYVLAELRTPYFGSLNQRSDLDKAVTHLTEAVLLSSTQHIVFFLFHLAVLLLSRFSHYKRPDDLKSSIKYLRFLRINFRSLEAFNIPHASGDLPTNLFHALARNLLLTEAPGEMARDIAEMVPLIPEFITADILTHQQRLAIKAFSTTFNTLELRLENIQQVVDQAIQELRKATMLNQDLWIAHALAMCLSCRFERTLVIKDCEEAIANFDRIVATCSPGNSLTEMQDTAMGRMVHLLLSRVNLSPTPEYLEDGIHRLRAFVPYPSSDEVRAHYTTILEVFIHRRLRFFGVTGNSGGAPLEPDRIATVFYPPRGPDRSQIQKQIDHLTDVNFAIRYGEITGVESAIEVNRKMIPLQPSSDQWTMASEPTRMFADILTYAYLRTKRLDYLNEAITTYRTLRKLSATPKMLHFDVGWKLHDCLSIRLDLLHLPQDVEEHMQTCSELANDCSGEVFIRLKISCFWAIDGRSHLHPSTPIAYETAMSLLQETLVFSPTLQTQHHRLADVLRKVGSFPSEYASYWIENDQVKRAIETLERARALIWSEMRGLRTSTDQLCAADPAIADKFSDINRRLELVAMSVAQSDEIGPSETGTGRREDSIGHLVLTQRRLLEERSSLISHIQSLPGLEDFLKPLSFDVLDSAAACGPVC